MGTPCRMNKDDQAKSISKKLSNLAKQQEISYRNVAMAFFYQKLMQIF